MKIIRGICELFELFINQVQTFFNWNEKWFAEVLREAFKIKRFLLNRFELGRIFFTDEFRLKFKPQFQ